MVSVPMVLPKTNFEDNKVHTIHHGKNSAFTLQIYNEKTQISKSSIIAFKQLEDSYKTAYILEKHKLVNKEYPILHSNNALINLYGNYDEIINLKELEIKTWNYNDLLLYSLDNYLNILTVFEITDDTDKTFKMNFKGKLHSIEGDHTFYSQVLNNLYLK